MREGSRNEKNEQPVGNLLLSSQRTTCMGPVGGPASSDSIRFCSNFASFCLIYPFVWILDSHLVELNLYLLPIWLQVVLDVCTDCQARIWYFLLLPLLLWRSSLRFRFFRVIVGIHQFFTCLSGGAYHSAIRRKPVSQERKYSKGV